jgi:hypothetical protein
MHRITAVLLAAACAVAVDAAGPQAASPVPQSIVGAWTLNAEKSDMPPPRGDGAERGGRGRAGGGGGGGGRRGGFGGGGGRGGGFGGGGGGGRDGRGGRGNPEDMQRRMNAMREILEPATTLTITRTESMTIITSGDGRTTRLATDGSKVKDDSTGIERKSRWDGDRLVSEVTGAACLGKITETYAVDPESHELIVTLQVEGGRQQPRGDRRDGDQKGPGMSGTRRHVYERVGQ